jgi:hypothetical protein
VESIHELESERDEKGECQKQERNPGCGFDVGI